MNTEHIAKIELQEMKLIHLLDIQGSKIQCAEVLAFLRERARRQPKTYEQVLAEAIASTAAGNPT